MLEQAYQTISDDEISLQDVIDFFRESWKIIAFSGVLGILAATGFIWVMPNQYQAIAQIQMAQISSNNNILGVNAEDPNLLMARLRLPSSYSIQEVKACGFEDSPTPFEALASSVKLSVVKGVGSLVELKINHESREIALVCLNTLFEKIKVSQNQIIKPYIEEAKILLPKYRDKLSDSQALVLRADKSGNALSAAYLANRDEVKFLTEEVSRLNRFLLTVDGHQTKLVAPIYIPDKPVFPQKKNSLVGGFLAGLFLGLFFVLIRNRWFT